MPTPLASTSDQDTTDILAGEGKITYQLNGDNRFEGYLSKQRYDKPNRGASNLNTQESNSKELDTFVIAQLAYNRVLSSIGCSSTRKVSYNNTHFPLYQKTDLQPLTDNTSTVLYRNRTNTAIMFRRRVQVDRQPALLPAAIRSAAATSSRSASTTATRRKTSIRFAPTTST